MTGCCGNDKENINKIEYTIGCSLRDTINKDTRVYKKSTQVHYDPVGCTIGFSCIVALIVLAIKASGGINIGAFIGIFAMFGLYVGLLHAIDFVDRRIT